MNHWIKGTLALLFVVAACSPDSTNPTGTFVPVCHIEGNKAAINQVQLTDLTEHKSHGDYVTTLAVDPLNTVGDGIHFKRVTDAVNAAREGRMTRGELATARCRVTIQVAPAILNGTAAESSDATLERFPIVIDVPDITLKGSFEMPLDAKGIATGVVSGVVTTFSPSPVLTVSADLVSEPIIIVNTHPQGSSGDGAIVDGFLFRTGRAATDTTVGGQGVLTLRARRLEIRNNRFEGGFTEALDLRASSALIEKNYLTGRGATCDICMAGPGDYTARYNRLNGPGGIPGIVAVPATLIGVPKMVEQYTLPASATVTSLIQNNEVRAHLAKPVGVGVRLGAVGIGAPNVVGTNKANVIGNILTGNTFGILVEAAFPVASGSLRGDIELSTEGNVISESCQNDLYVSFSRHTTGLGLTNQPYLKNTKYELNLGSDIPWDKAWYAHPAGFGNSLLMDGVGIPNAIHHSYDAAKPCS